MGKPHASYDFRNDINGLRAWAVVAVMFYHFGIPGFSGGFVGVDVFFVISGFLMTSIVVRGLEKRGGDESFVFDFYMARARRILPALIVLCAGLLVLGWWVLSPIDYKVLGIHAALSLVFLSNIKFWSEAGYFDAASHEKWLLHTWSLAVEWQFYLLLPLVLLAVWKVRPGRQSITVAISLGFLVSIALSIVLTPVKPSTAFYLLHTRAWELLAGGLVYLLSNQLELNAHQRKALELAGFGMVLGSVVGFDASTNWPGWRALIPVIGSILVLTAAQSHSALTGHFVTQWLGRSSYSIYLWHWPIVAMLAYLGLQTDAMAIGSGLALTLVLGYLSFRWVETPSRQHLFRCRTGYATSALLCGVLIVTIPAVGIWRNNGILSRTSAEMVLVEKEASNKNPRESSCFTKRGTSSPSCIYGGDRLRAILIGDSHAAAVITALAAVVQADGDGVMDLTYVSCLTALGVKNLSPLFGPDEKCGEFLEWAVKKLADIPADIPLVIVNRTTSYAFGNNETWEKDANKPGIYFDYPHSTTTPAFLTEFAQHVTDTACQLAKSRPVYMVRPIPEMGIDVPKAMARAIAIGGNREISISLADYHQRHDFVWAMQDAIREKCGVKILDPLPYLCQDGRCQAARDGRPVYYDDDHLSEFGNKLLVPMFAEVFQTN